MQTESLKNFNTEIEKYLNDQFVDYIGFADLSRYEDELIKTGGPIVKGYKSGISIGIVIPDSIIDFLPERFEQNIACENITHGFEVLNNRLNYIASSLSSYLNKMGYRTLPIAAANRTDKENAIASVSHKMVARIAGGGWIGKNCLFINPIYGPRLRLITILTNAPLKTVDIPMESKCKECMECVKICPVDAIKGINYIDGDKREIRFDFKKCQEYDSNIKKDRLYGFCSMCLYICPYGKKNDSSE